MTASHLEFSEKGFQGENSSHSNEPCLPFPAVKSLRSSQALAAVDDFHSVPELILQSGFERHIPLLVCAESVASHTALRETSDLCRQFFRSLDEPDRPELHGSRVPLPGPLERLPAAR